MNEKVHNTAKSNTLIVKAHAELRNNIILGHHQPGEKLRVEHLKLQYGVSSTTLREALTMLIADGLVVVEGQRGFKVKPVSVEDLIDLNRIRIILEKEAIRQSIAHGDEEWEGRVVSAYHLLNRAMKYFSSDFNDQALFDEFERRHRIFHTTLFSADPSEWTQYFLSIAYQQCERYRYRFHVMTQSLYRAKRSRDVDAEHTEIFDAVLARDADAAAVLLERHLMKTLDEWIEFFEKTAAFESGQVSPKSKPRRGAGRTVRRQRRAS